MASATGGSTMPGKLLIVMLCLSAVPALAAGDPDAIKGLLAEHCSQCHAIPGFPAPDTGLSAPAFTTIANDPTSYPEKQLRTFLQKPHWPMTAFILSPSDIDNILAYLATLRQ
jgi:mono/diheme cytochrome c family protein